MTIDQAAAAPAVPDEQSEPLGPSLIARTARRPEFGALIGAVVVYVFFLVTTSGSGFTSVDGTASWLDTAAELGVVATPVALLLIAGEFDLSIGSVVGATSAIVAIASGTYTMPQWASIPLAIGFGLLVGLVNGLVATRTKLPSFIVTLGSSLVVGGGALGLSRALSGSTAVTLTPEPSVQAVFGSKAGQFQVSIAWWLAIAVVAWWVLTRTRTGSWIYATGGAPDVARDAGVPTARVKVGLFMATSVGAALVGVLQTIAYSGGDVTRGSSFIFDGVIAAVIGGVLLQGGYGSTLGVLLGTATYGIVSLGIFYTGWNTDYAQLFLGALLLVAVMANNYFRKLALSGR
ncbi:MULTISPECIES: ABC transporter permease [unclassified Streptomyces]|uniref:ABC transporter permease n=1 Tax=unclassified Streptomyces TaxID=2593676 RepID=UPI0022576744|nr:MULTISPECIES: ABC transporter permease [unclassified Streptomyces]MCX4406938.1 ABC transporter permease [Streptomyces sp. NBC_01764]MCX5188374.1 ABC transporter permease [Streptomyces sp. NBC_00268]